MKTGAWLAVVVLAFLAGLGTHALWAGNAVTIVLAGAPVRTATPFPPLSNVLNTPTATPLPTNTPRATPTATAAPGEAVPLAEATSTQEDVVLALSPTHPYPKPTETPSTVAAQPGAGADFERWGRVISPSGLNVRAGPGTEYAVIAALNYGDAVRLETLEPGWYGVTVSGRRGYITSDPALLQVLDGPPPRVIPAPSPVLTPTWGSTGGHAIPGQG